jgi:hypothetical protein
LLSWKRFYNRSTGAVVHLPTGRFANFQGAIHKLVQYVRCNIARYYVAHVTLTVGVPRADCFSDEFHRAVNFIRNRLNRQGSDFKYVAVKEIQLKRLAKYGDAVIHYHVLCVYSKAYVFPSWADIQQSWGVGNVTITAPKIRMRFNRIADYLGKYLGKGYEFEELDVAKTFTASQIAQIYKLGKVRLDTIKALFPDRWKGLKCSYRKVFEWVETMAPFRPKKEILHEFQSDWQFLGLVGEPF